MIFSHETDHAADFIHSFHGWTLYDAIVENDGSIRTTDYYAGISIAIAIIYRFHGGTFDCQVGNSYRNGITEKTGSLSVFHFEVGQRVSLTVKRDFISFFDREGGTLEVNVGVKYYFVVYIGCIV